MPSNKPTDELLAALPEVGLGLWMLDQVGAVWHAAVFDPKRPVMRWEGEGYSPATALMAALADAGVVLEDEPSEDATYLKDLAARLFMYGTPDHGTDGGDVDRLTEIANRL